MGCDIHRLHRCPRVVAAGGGGIQPLAIVAILSALTFAIANVLIEGYQLLNQPPVSFFYHIGVFFYSLPQLLGYGPCRLVSNG